MLSEFGFCTLFRCDSGYILSGFERRCCIAGVWIPAALPTCILSQVNPITTTTTPVVPASRCPDPPTVANAQLSPAVGPYKCGSMITYSCVTGFVMSGHENLTCSTSGTWIGAVPSCDAITCLPVTSIANGLVSPSNGPWTFGSRLNFSCNANYVRNGVSYVICQADGTWSDNVPACTSVDDRSTDTCSSPLSGSGLNAAPLKTNYNLNDIVIFWCDAGYVIQGSQVLQCTSGGQWSATPPTCKTVSCGAVEALDNGSFEPVLTTYPFGTIVTYMCSSGFAISGGNVKITCLDNGTWSGSPPTCVASTCPTPSMSDNALHFPAAGPFDVGDIIVSVCNAGYTQAGGDNTRVCQAGGTWSNSPIICTNSGSQNDCAAPPSILNGGYRPNQSGYSATTTINYFCNSGYKLASGDASLTCFVDGSWKGTVPVCIPDTAPTCSSPPDIKHGSIVLQRSRYVPGDIVFYTCNSGYSLTAGDSRLTCRPDGVWEGTVPTCSYRGSQGCAPPRPVANGRSLPERNLYAVGEAVFFFCSEGYTLNSGNRWVTCQEGGTWQGIIPLCLKNDADSRCGSAPALAQGSYQPQKTTYAVGEYAYYSCNVNFRLIATHSRRQCLPDGSWEQINMFCTPFPPTQCSEPTQAPFSTYTPIRTRYSVGEQVYYVCASAYNQPLNSAPTQTAVRMCGTDGTWYGSMPNCTGPQPGTRCVPPSSVANALFTPVRSLYIPGEVVTYTCSAGSWLGGSVSQLVCSSSGTWIGTTPVCTVGQCTSPPQVANANHSPVKPSYTNGEQILYTCSTGFYLSGNPILTCSSQGAWNGRQPFCIRDLCSVPPNVRNGFYSPTRGQYQVGETVVYTCSPGYVLLGTQIRCSPGGVWSGQHPACVVQGARSCVTPPNVANANYAPVQLVYSAYDRVSYTCAVGFSRVAGDASLYCGGDGSWTGTPPTCQSGIQRCDVSVTRIRNGYHTPRKSVYGPGDRVYFECNTGYKRVVGDLKITCAENGQWIGQPAVCQSEGCKPPQSTLCAYTPQLSQYASGNTITYSCPSGYVIVSAYTSITCLGNDQWSNPPPIIRRGGCAPPVITSGFYEPQRSVYTSGETVSFSCALGYRLVGSSTVVCNLDTWSARAPTCNPVTCTRPALPAFAAAERKEVYYLGERVNYVCVSGYQMDAGVAYIECLPTAQWTAPVAKCNAPLCSPPPVVRSASHRPQTGPYTYNTQLLYTCMAGFILANGNGVLRCAADRTWVGERPVCQRITCGAPPSISQGSYSPQQQSYVLDSLVTYSCEGGLAMQGEPTMRCMSCGGWSPQTAPRCPTRPCSQPPRVSDGNYSPQRSSYTSGERVVYTCNSGYRLNGNIEARCLQTGNWDRTQPTCLRISCPLPATVSHARVSPDQSIYSPGDTITYTCDTGYTLSDSAQLTCSSAGEWSGQTPTCSPRRCGLPPLVEHANYSPTSNSYRIGDSVTYRCSTGYIMTGSATISCSTSGTWSTSPPTCSVNMCTLPPAVANARYSPTRTMYSSGDVVTYSCSSGYAMNGDASLTCSSTGVWTGATPSCTARTCSVPPEVQSANYSPIQSSYNIGETVRYLCSTGYALIGSSSITCSSGEAWSPAAPSCSRIAQCNSPPSALSASYTPLKPRYGPGERVTYTCSSGYQRVSGDEFLTCSRSGSWSGSLPVCSAIVVECRALPSVPFARYSPSKAIYAVGDVVTYACASGYSHVAGSSSRTCESSGSWSGTSPVCRSSTCSFPPTVSRATYSPNKQVYYNNEVIVYTCAPGYLLGSIDRLTCTNGQWVGALPTCNLVGSRTSCSNPPVPSSGSYVPYDPNGYNVGVSVTYTCNSGFSLVGVDSNKCLGNGEWEHPVVGHCTDVLLKETCFSKTYIALRRTTIFESTANVCEELGMQPWVPQNLEEFICMCDALIESGYAVDFFWSGVREEDASFLNKCNEPFYQQAIDSPAPREGNCLALQNDRIYYRSCGAQYNILCQTKTC